MLKSETTQKILIGIFILGCVGIVIYFVAVKERPRSIIELEGVYDANGNLLAKPYSIVGGVSGAKFIKLRINIQNKDTLPINVYVANLTPSGIDYAKPNTQMGLAVSNSGSWLTGLIDVTPYEGLIQDFCANIIIDRVPILRESSMITGCLSLRIDKEIIANFSEDNNFSIIVDSSTGDSSVNPGCKENWLCTEWTACQFNIKTRTCSDSNNCGTILNKPNLQDTCQVSPNFQTNYINTYKDTTIWIQVYGLKYYYDGYSSYRCLPENILLKTPEGYNLCTRPPYEVTQRVYIDDGHYGLIFKR